MKANVLQSFFLVMVIKEHINTEEKWKKMNTHFVTKFKQPVKHLNNTTIYELYIVA